MDRLLDSRTEIDRIDRDLIRLLAERMDAVRAIGAFKREHADAPLQDETREREIFERWTRRGEEAGLSGYFLGRILREVLNYSRRDQERLLDTEARTAGESGLVRVGYQGVAASFSELAARKLFATRATGPVHTQGYHTFAEVLDALSEGEITYALLPVENTIAGSINEVYQLLAQRSVVVVDEEIWPVEHCLVGLPGVALHELRTVRSHPVALQQCRRFLDGLVGCVSESVYDTAAACQSVAELGDRTIAAIGSEEAAERSGLAILRRQVADQTLNMTRFLLIAREPEPIDPRRPAKTSLLFTTNHQHGALAEVLAAFAAAGLNLTKLESRPQPDSPWEYLFYLDVEGAAEDPRVAGALETVRGHTNHLRILGSYPNRTREESAWPTPPPRAATVTDGPPSPEDAPAADEPAPVAAELPSPALAAAPTSEPRPGDAVCPIPKPGRRRLAVLEEGAARSVLRIGGVEVGGDRFTLIAGPCAVESRAQIHEAAAMVKQHGASLLRGGAFKPRSSPYSFQGLGFEGLELLVDAGRAYEMPVVTEVLRAEDAAAIARSADVLQVGARNMQNFSLLKELGRLHRPVLLKRGLSATIDELLLAAEYVMAGGNHQVILCERGIRTFETATRSTLDVSAVPVLKARTHLPVIVDPSHAAGVRELVVPLALAAAACGADGLIVEAHPDPDRALCDKEQALTADDLAELWAGLAPIVRSRGKTL